MMKGDEFVSRNDGIMTMKYKSFKKLTAVILTSFIRDKFILFSLIIVFLLVVYSFLRFVPTKDFINMVYSGQYSQIIAMLFFAVTGVKLGQSRKHIAKHGNADEIFSKTKESFTESNNTSAYLKGLYLAVFFSLIYILNLVLFAFITCSDIRVVIHTIYYIILRVVLPNITCVLLGVCIGKQIRGNLAFGIAITIWIFLSPISTIAREITSFALKADSKSLDYFFNIINIGGALPKDIASPYGFNLNLPVWISNLGILLIAISWCFFSSLNFHAPRRSCIKSAFIVSIHLGVLFLGISLSASTDNKSFFDNYDSYSVTQAVSDLNYYESNYVLNKSNLGKTLKNNITPDFSKDINIVPLRYSIELNPKSIKMDVKCHITARMTERSNSQSFTLYRDFRISSVFLNNKEAEFIQDGDYFIIFFSDALEVNEELEIEISYSGVSSPIYPANRQLISLPSSYPWLPRVGMIEPVKKSVEAMSTCLTMFTPWITDNSIDFDVTMDTDQLIYINLPQVGRGAWKGKSCNGLSIVKSDLLKKAEIDDYTIYYPATLQKYNYDLVQMAKKTASEFQKILESTTIKPNTFSNTVIVFPTNPSQPNSQQEVYFYSNDNVLYFSSANNAFTYLYDTSEPQARTLTTFYSLVSNPNFMRATSVEPISLIVAESWYRWYKMNFSDSESKEINIWDFSDYFVSTYYKQTGNLYDTSDAQIEEFLNGLNKIVNNDNLAYAQTFFSWWYESCMNGKYPEIKEYIYQVQAS